MFASATNPDLINFDGDKVLLCTKKENKTIDNYLHQYKYAGLYLDRREAIDFISKKQDDVKAVEFMKLAVNDKYSGLRNFAIGKLDMKKDAIVNAVETSLTEIAKKDASRIVRSKAVETLGNLKKPAYKSLFQSLLSDSSYTLSAAALLALEKIDAPAALTEAKLLSKQKMKGALMEAVNNHLNQKRRRICI
jgi:aminopeptidase N